MDIHRNGPGPGAGSAASGIIIDSRGAHTAYLLTAGCAIAACAVSWVGRARFIDAELRALDIIAAKAAAWYGVIGRGVGARHGVEQDSWTRRGFYLRPVPVAAPGQLRRAADVLTGSLIKRGPGRRPWPRIWNDGRSR